METASASKTAEKEKTSARSNPGPPLVCGDGFRYARDAPPLRRRTGSAPAIPTNTNNPLINALSKAVKVVTLYSAAPGNFHSALDT